jgi:hypothetical protein
MLSNRHGGEMIRIAMLAAALAAMMLGGCASYAGGGYVGYYDGWGGDARDSRHSRSGGGRSEPGNEAGMFPGRPGDGRGSPGGGNPGGSRGGEAGSR